MSQTLGKLKILPDNKTVVFWSPIEGDDVLVRTGTDTEGNSFIHSLLYAYSKEYINMDKHGRMKFVKRLRASMYGKITKEDWEEIGGGLIAKIPFRENITIVLKNFYEFLDNSDININTITKKVIKKMIGNDTKQIEIYSLIKELISLKDFEKILQKTYSHTEKEKINVYSKSIINETINYLNKKDEIKSIKKEKAEYIKNTVRKFLDRVFVESEKSAFKNYVKGLKNITEDIDSYTIKLFSERFNRDIYFLNYENRMPFNITLSNENIKRRKAIIVLSLSKNHYEIIGRLLPGNRIQREFDNDDSLVEKIHTFLVYPEKVSKKYPELIKYLPTTYDSDQDSYKKSNASDCDDSE